MLPDTQTTIAQATLDLFDAGTTTEIDPEGLQDILDGPNATARGEIATDDEALAAFRDTNPEVSTVQPAVQRRPHLTRTVGHRAAVSPSTSS